MAPMRVGWSPSVEATMRAEGRPRRMLRWMVSPSEGEMSDQARVIRPPTTTVSGLRPTMRFEIPMPS